MKNYIYRNSTIENLLGNKEFTYSGYEDISIVNSEFDAYIWFYIVPVKTDQKALINEILDYYTRIEFIFNSISSDKLFILISLEDLYSLEFTTNSFEVKEAILECNQKMIELSRSHSNVKYIDFSDFIKKYPFDSLIDWKYYFLSQIQLSPRLASSFREWFYKQLDEIYLKRKKCLVLDLDNTIWGGILGEDGVNGLKVDGDYPGNAFLFFQKALIELADKGIILTLCSKNNEEDVLEAVQKNPSICLIWQYISAYRINWNDKASNIRELAEELNIGLDSFVFIDDNPAERELVRQFLPEVEVPDFPQQPYELPVFLKKIVYQYFKIYSITEEDKDKTNQYKENIKRNIARKNFQSFDEFLESLEIELDIQSYNENNVTRISQMTQKTNQFNLTTKRYHEVDIVNYFSKGSFIYSLGVKDKFGDNGITGCAIITHENVHASIDTFLLSCRILGKKIEFAFLYKVLQELKKRGIKDVTALYLPSPKNQQVEDFYDKAGFTLLESSIDGSKQYYLNLEDAKLNIESYYKIEVR